MIRIYMNEHMKERDPNDPVIAVFETQSKRLVYTDVVQIIDNEGTFIGEIRFEPKGVKGLPHEVRACVTIFSANNIKVFDEQTG